jgi:hypothetical protein
MDWHQFRGARIHRDMMLVSSVCRRALGCEWGGERFQSCGMLFSGLLLRNLEFCPCFEGNPYRGSL